jgi:hypothetical protein
MTNYELAEEARAKLQKIADGYLIKAEITPKKLLDMISKLG